MKCSFCSNELEAGAQFCPHCGMILSLGEEETPAQETQNTPAVEEKTENVFTAQPPIAEESFHVAMELEADDTEEFVPVVEGIPEYVSAFPEEQQESEQEVENETEEPAAAEAVKEEEPETEAVPVVYNLEDDLDEDAGISHAPTREETAGEFVIQTSFDEEDDALEEIDDEEDDEDEE